MVADWIRQLFRAEWKLHCMLLLAVVAFTMSCSQPSPIDINNVNEFPRLHMLNVLEPVAPASTHQYTHHGITLNDPYHWLKDPDYPHINDPTILSYIAEENEYYHQFIKPHKSLVNTLLEEFKSRTNEQEISLPFIKNGYEYWWEYAPQTEYKNYYRKNLSTQQQQLLINQVALADKHDYFVLGDWAISSNNEFIAYSVDTDGDERYTIFIKNINTGELIERPIINASDSVAFAKDGDALIYGKLHQTRWFIESIALHTIGSDSQNDVYLFTESDMGFNLDFHFSSSEQWLFITSSTSTANEIHILPTNDLNAAIKTLVARQQKIMVDIDHANSHFYILANDAHVNFRLAVVSDSDPSYSNWSTKIAGSDKQYLKDIKTFKDFLVLRLSVQGQDYLRILPNKGEPYNIEFPETLYDAQIGQNEEFDQDFLRINYTSMITPQTVVDVNIENRTRKVMKQRFIPSGYDKDDYETVRLMAPSRDGKLIPVSIVTKKGFKQNATHPMSLTAYGAYGAGYDVYFSTTRLSLLDRGFSVAIAHTRGGDEMGYQWYLEGKLHQRQNSFNDFIDVARHLIQEKYVAKGNISISGASAGGQMVGAMVIQAPDLWRSASLLVPFVDVLNTMLDETLALTPGEWEEWGNPVENKAVFEYMLAYSPYNQIEARSYPPMLVTGGLNDPRVTYWEPTKWTAMMRTMKIDSNLLVMKMNMGAGHFANSGRYAELNDIAEDIAFQLVAHGVTE